MFAGRDRWMGVMTREMKGELGCVGEIYGLVTIV